MNKTEIKKALNISQLLNSAKNNNVNTELDNLRKIESVLNELSTKVNKRQIEITKGLLHCSSCHKFFKKDPNKVFYTEKIETRIAYWDSGYGDDDRYVDCHVYYTKIKCPFCEHELQLDRYIGDDVPGTEVDRYGHVYN